LRGLRERGADLRGAEFQSSVACLLVPIYVVGGAGVRTLYGRPIARARWFDVLGLAVPSVLGFGYAFPRALPTATLPVIAASAALALVNGTLEELLWRGAYISVFPESRLLGWFYPALGFAAWHFAPQSVFPNRAPGGALSLVAVSAVVGLLWGRIAMKNRSIRWTSVAHVVFDFSGLGARLYLR
jgi:hypothetical protein